MITRTAQIESLLFFEPRSWSVSELAQTLGQGEKEVRDALRELESELTNRGIRLVTAGESVMLRTAPEMSARLEAITKAELERDLGKAALETLSIVLYYGPITRSGIDYVRGVNSSYILRNLSVRGLIERIENPDSKRSYLYGPTVELLGHLGITRVEDLPEYDTVKAELASFESSTSDHDDTA